MAGILVEHKLRPCYIDRSSKKKVQKEKALFHGWSRISNVVEPSLMIGGAPGGTISYTTGIVEFEDGHVEEVFPETITFVVGIFSEYSWGEEIK